jgi:hypothetical protein
MIQTSSPLPKEPLLMALVYHQRSQRMTFLGRRRRKKEDRRGNSIGKKGTELVF